MACGCCIVLGGLSMFEKAINEITFEPRKDLQYERIDIASALRPQSEVALEKYKAHCERLYAEQQKNEK